jgi:nitroimidazol reductase NimA-like FMN-containing flavoprotein (pyridoxamine 5'-phosphate oxidase superfamily)
MPTPELDARFSAPDAVATRWENVARVLEEAELFWISTVRADGQPHVTPLPAVWDDGRLHFCTGASEQKGVNLARNRRCTLTTGSNTWNAGLDVVVEGLAERIDDDARLRELAELWATKYHGDWTFDVHDGAFHHEGGEALVFGVRPTKVLSFAKGDFAQTRYRFRTVAG